MIEHYINEVPVEIRETVMELSSDQKWAVYLALVKEGRRNFTEMKDLFKANPNTMNLILKSLVAGGVVGRKVQVKDIGDRRKIYYEPTPLGFRFLNALYDVILPPLVSTREIMDYVDFSPVELDGEIRLDPHMKSSFDYDTVSVTNKEVTSDVFR